MLCHSNLKRFTINGEINLKINDTESCFFYGRLCSFTATVHDEPLSLLPSLVVCVSDHAFILFLLAD